MFVRRKRGWELPESAATSESVYLQRRNLVKAIAAGPILLGASRLIGSVGGARAATADDPTAELYPVQRNMRYRAPRDITGEDWVTTYNNFYEFGSHKRIHRAAQRLQIRPWQVRIDGMVEQEKTVDIDDLIRAMPLEERIYAHRCVEAWSMVVPWSGFPMKSFVDFAKPLSSARYVRMETFHDPDIAPGQRQRWFPWPYIEGLTMAEATHELAFLVTGVFGHPNTKQNGAPLRLAVPWKYGFKHTKSIVRFSFTDERPKSFWEALQGNEYGFWANVNPEVPHPRWSQATERVIGTDERVPTELYNGYAEYVADLYTGMEGEVLFR